MIKLMNKVLKNALLGLLGVLLVILFYFAYLETHKVQINKNLQLSALLGVQGEPLHLDIRTKSQDCQVLGPLPDHDCTPGAIFSDATKEEICVQGYTKTVRSVSTSLREKVFAEYGISYPQPYGSYEVDHLIPLALGGNNDVSNLFPESAEPYSGFKEKDVVENYLHEEVCAGGIDLATAHATIATDWLLIYNNLSDEKVKELKNKYRSWAE